MQSEQTFNVSLTWILLGLLGVVLLGFFGGVAAQQVFPAVTPIQVGEDQIITTVQKVTLSPGKAAAEVAERWKKSVFLIGPVSEQFPPIILSDGLLVTNDGLLVTVGEMPLIPLQAYGYEGDVIGLEKAGYDALYDLTYYRLRDGVFSAVDFGQGDPEIASDLMTLSLLPSTFESAVSQVKLGTYELPGEMPAGVMRVLQMTPNLQNSRRGTPLMNDEGRVSGIVMDATVGKGLAVTDLEESMRRVTQNKLEDNVLLRIGLDVQYIIDRVVEGGSPRYLAKVIGVTPGGIAQKSGFRVRDSILAIDAKSLAWEGSFVEELVSRDGGVTIDVARGEEQLSLRLSI